MDGDVSLKYCVGERPINEQEIKQILKDFVEQEVPDDLDLWPAIEARLKPDLPNTRQARLSRMVLLSRTFLVFLTLVVVLSSFAVATIYVVGVFQGEIEDASVLQAAVPVNIVSETAIPTLVYTARPTMSSTSEPTDESAHQKPTVATITVTVPPTTYTPTPTDTSTFTPTASATPLDITLPTATMTPIPTPTNTPTPLRNLNECPPNCKYNDIAVLLIGPEAGKGIENYTTFVWTWPGALLPEYEQFQFRIFHIENPGSAIFTDESTNDSYTLINPTFLNCNERYLWSVQVASFDDKDKFIAFRSLEGEKRSFVWRCP